MKLATLHSVLSEVSCTLLLGPGEGFLGEMTGKWGRGELFAARGCKGGPRIHAFAWPKATEVGGAAEPGLDPGLLFPSP